MYNTGQDKERGRDIQADNRDNFREREREKERQTDSETDTDRESYRKWTVKISQEMKNKKDTETRQSHGDADYERCDEIISFKLKSVK